MNSFTGEIIDIATEGQLSLVKVNINGITFSSIVIENPDQSSSLRIGNPVSVLFKETEVVIGIGSLATISLRNKVEGKIKGMKSGKLLSRITIDSVIGPITSIITTHSAEKLGLTIGGNVSAMIKTNEVMLSL